MHKNNKEQDGRPLSRKELRAQKKQEKARAKAAFVPEQDPYYGLRLKPRAEYQRQYEETLSFQKIDDKQVEKKDSGTFDYLFDPNASEKGAADEEVQQRLGRLHEARRRRMDRMVAQGGGDVEKTDIFRFTTTLSLDAIRQAAAKAAPDTTPEQGPAPIQEPRGPAPKPLRESPAPAIQEPSPQPKPLRVQGAHVEYRPLHIPMHTVDLQDYLTPLFHEARQYAPLAAHPQQSADAADEPAPANAQAPQADAADAPDPANAQAPQADVADEPAPANAQAPQADAADEPAPADAQAPQADVADEPAPADAQAPQADVADEPAPANAQAPQADAADEPAPADAQAPQADAADEPAPADAQAPQADAAPDAPHVVDFAAWRDARQRGQGIPADVLDAGEEDEAAAAQVPELYITQQDEEEEDPETAPAPEDPPAAQEADAPEPQPLFDESAGKRRASNQPHWPRLLRNRTEIEDYEGPDDAPSILRDLAGQRRLLLIRLLVTAVTALLGLGVSLLVERQVLPVLSGLPYLVLSLAFLLFSIGFCAIPIVGGLRALCTLRANADSAVAVAAAAALVQTVAALFQQQGFAAQGQHLYAPLVLAALFLNTLGKYASLLRIGRNFKFLAAPGEKFAVRKYEDHNVALQMTQSSTVETPAIAYQNRCGNLRHFLRLSYSDTPSDRLSQLLAPLLALVALALGLLSGLRSGNPLAGLATFAAATCAATPFMNMLSVNLPLSRLGREALQCGGMVVGYPALKYFSDTNAVLLDAKDLFPRSMITLNGIKTFGGQHVDDAIIDAATVMYAAGGPLGGIFGQVMRANASKLGKAENLQYQDQMGISAWVGGRQVLVGNRRLLEAYHITPPEPSVEARYMQGGRQVTYVAVGGALAAMFLLTYRADRRRAGELQRMEQAGISLLLRSNDPNVTGPFVAALFGVDVQSVHVLPARLGQAYAALVREPDEEAHALLAVSKGRPTTMLRLLTACVRQHSSITMAVLMQTAAAVVGVTLTGLLCLWQGLQLSPLLLLLYELAWGLLIWLLPRLQRL